MFGDGKNRAPRADETASEDYQHDTKARTYGGDADTARTRGYPLGNRQATGDPNGWSSRR